MALLRALAAGAPPFTLNEAISRDWASATFTGERHLIRVELADDAATAAWLADLPDAELVIRGQIVADLTVGEVTRAEGRVRCAIEALLIVDG